MSKCDASHEPRLHPDRPFPASMSDFLFFQDNKACNYCLLFPFLICLNCNWSQRGGMNGIFHRWRKRKDPIFLKMANIDTYLKKKKSSPQGSRTAMVRRPCGYCAMTARYYGYREISVREPCNSCAMIVRISYDLTISVRCCFAPLLKKKLYARCMISARTPHDDPALIVRCHLRCV